MELPPELLARRPRPTRESLHFVLSPANASGRRAQLLLNEAAEFSTAQRFRNGEATIGEVYSFISGLYFRGKLAYSQAFSSTVLVITPGEGLVSASTVFTPTALRAMAAIEIDLSNPAYLLPLQRDLAALRLQTDRCVLLGSIATPKYVEPLLSVFGDKLLFPAEFVGRGDMSRGGLLLRCVESGCELDYVPVLGAIRTGKRPPKLLKKA